METIALPFMPDAIKVYGELPKERKQETCLVDRVFANHRIFKVLGLEGGMRPVLGRPSSDRLRTENAKL